LEPSNDQTVTRKLGTRSLSSSFGCWQFYDRCPEARKTRVLHKNSKIGTGSATKHLTRIWEQSVHFRNFKI